MQLVAELEQIKQELGACDDEVRRLCEGLGPEELGWRPSPKSWSIAETLNHLRITTEVFAPAAERAIRVAREQGLFSQGPFPMGRMDRIFVWYVEPPPKIRLPAPKPLKPPLEESTAEAALQEFLDSQDLMIRQVHSANGLDLCRARVVSPIASYVRMSLLAFFNVHTGHERRHLLQVSGLRDQLQG